MLSQLTLHYARSTVSIILLTASSLQDVRKREIDDRVWIVFTIAALILNIIGVLTGLVELLGWLVFSGLQAAFFILLYYAGTFGGADAKSLICLSIMYPTCLVDFMHDLSIGMLTVPLSSFNNALVFTLAFPLSNLAWNIYVKHKGIELFKGLERESLLRKFFALLLLRKIRFSQYSSNKHRFTLSEKYTRSGVRRIVFYSRLEEEPRGRFKDEDYVFTSFLIPLQVFILLGLVVRLLYGDVVLKIALTIVMLLLKGF